MSDLNRFALACAGLLALVWIVQRLPRLTARLLALAVVLLITGDSEARVMTLTAEDDGGSVAAFAAAVDGYIRHKDSVRVDGACASACTMLLALPPSRICITPRARFAFHEAYNLLDRFDPTHKTRSDEGTAILMRHYPPQIKAWIAAQGGLSPDLIILDGAALRGLLPACSDGARR